MKGFVFAEADFAGRHLRGQPLVFLPAEFGQERFHLAGEGLLRPIGTRQEFVQAGQSQEPAHVAQPAVIGLHKNQMERHQQPVQEGEPLGGFQKPDLGGRTPAFPAALAVGSQAMPERTIGHAELLRDLPPRMPPEADLLGTFDDLGVA